MKLMGVDVGFSKKRRTTGIACLDGDLVLIKAGTAWDARQKQIPRGFRPEFIAIDGPLLPRGADTRIRRRCEFVFVHAPFHNRCKPGLSHGKSGRDLRRASAQACTQFSKLLQGHASKLEATHVCHEGPIVEAFPNAFLGVLLPEDLLPRPKTLKRGQRFDVLYESFVTTRPLASELSKEVDLPSGVWDRLRNEKDHELRAALICLVTAALAAQGTATVVGEATGGWFWLPPYRLWQPWAREGLSAVLARTKGAPLDRLSSDRGGRRL
jgi:Protein of unknown function (DUF429)